MPKIATCDFSNSHKHGSTFTKLTQDELLYKVILYSHFDLPYPLGISLKLKKIPSFLYFPPKLGIKIQIFQEHWNLFQKNILIY